MRILDARRTAEQQTVERMASRVLITLMLLSGLRVTSCQHSSQCPSTSPGGIHFSITTRRNNTGHWLSLVNLKQVSGIAVSDNKETGSLEVDVQQTSQKCENWEEVNVKVSLAAPPPRAGPGYELVPELGYYKFHTTPKTWPEARQICSEEGAHLAIVNSEKELKALQGIFSLHPQIQDGWQNYHAHVGFHDLYEEGKYMTIFGDSLESTGYSKFADGKPTGVGMNCGCIHRALSGLWDTHCLSQFSFFCEQDIS